MNVLTASVASAVTVAFGHSVHGRPLVAQEIAGVSPRTTVLVVGCVHGNERAGIAIANALEHAAAPAGVALWVVPVLNPDGVAAGTRQNAHHVDLNRNFPVRWRHLTGIFFSGPHPLSEPESRAAYRLILRIHPTVTIWFHQHLDLVDDSSGSKHLESIFAQAAALPMLPLPRYPGSAVTWESSRFPQSTSFVVELPAGKPSPAAVARYVRAVLAVARAASRPSP